MSNGMKLFAYGPTLPPVSIMRPMISVSSCRAVPLKSKVPGVTPPALLYVKP